MRPRTGHDRRRRPAGPGDPIARRPNAWAAHHVTELVEPYGDERPEAWRTWPPVDPATLPEVDTTGWVLTPLAAMAEFLEELERNPDHADTVTDTGEQAARWIACGVADLEPQLVAVRRPPWFDDRVGTLRQLADEDGDDEFVRMLLVASTPGDADVEALLRIAVDATRDHRDTIDIDAATTATYRRVLDRMGLPFDNYAFEAMFE